MTMQKPEFKAGIITDIQYADQPSWNNRYFRESINKLRNALHYFNNNAVDFVINLGDSIDQDFYNLDTVLKEFKTLNCPVYHLLGNHDFLVEKEKIEKVYQYLTPNKSYYYFNTGDWTFIMLNGNTISLRAWPEDSLKYQQSLEYFKKIKSENKINAYEFNGGIDNKQLEWLNNILLQCRKKEKKVIICCHYPVFTENNSHNLFNYEEILELLQKYPEVKVWFNGHYHEGGYQFWNNKHLVNFKGMVETHDITNFALLYFYEDSITIYGYGDEPSRVLKLYD